MIRWFMTGITAAALLGAPARGEDPLKREDLEKMLEQLEVLRKSLNAKHARENAGALKAFASAAQSPVSAGQFYMDCLKKTRFVDAGKRTSVWREYRDRREDEFDSLYFRQAQQLKLKYLVLTIKAGQEEDRTVLVPALISLLDEVSKLDGRAHDAVEGSVDGSIYVEAYAIENSINPGSWAMDLSNIPAVYETNIFPLYRKDKNPLLVSAWQSCLSQTTDFMRAKDVEFKRQEREARKEERQNGGGPVTSQVKENPYDIFQREELPEIKWAMCLDLNKHGFQDQALVHMFEVIGEHKDYPEMATWLSELETELRIRLGLTAAPPATAEGETGDS